MARSSSRSSSRSQATPPPQTAVTTPLTWLRANVEGLYNTHLRGRPSRLGAALVLLGILIFVSGGAFRGDTQSVASNAAWQQHFDWRSTGDKTSVWLVPGELPGYTGWARPGATLAGHFQLVAPLDMSQPAIAGEIWEMTIQCFLTQCTKGGALFFVRAYGPAVIVGKVNDNKDGTYRIELLPKDPGPYTVEVVLTFSNPTSFGQFPLPLKQQQPPYEGYLLPEFPLPLQVVPAKHRRRTKSSPQQLPLCTMQDLLEETPTSAWEKARWVVKDKVNHPHHHNDDKERHKDVTFAGFQGLHNSLGIQMDYEYDKCHVMPAFTAQDADHVLHKCSREKGPLHFLFIGDSNMKLQRNVFEEFFLQLPEDEREKSRYNQHKIRASYFDLTGGALRCNIIGGDQQNVTRFFETLYAREDKSLELPERYVILFNTGMHDIHRLCSQEFRDDRATYLGEESGDTTQGFHCVQHYRMAVEGLAGDVRNFRAALRIFQSTTAGWPKYGNYGVVWPPDGAQHMPVATEFVDFFNEIAFDVIKEAFPTIPIMDGYWVSYARPDNREIALGMKKVLEKKLSHPGLEVVFAMLRKFSTIVAQSELCS